MRTSNIAFLVLAASAAAPAFAAPLLHTNARAEDGVAPLNSRQYSQDCSGRSGHQPNRLYLDDKTAPPVGLVGVATKNDYGPANKRDIQPAARDLLDEFMASVANSGSDQAVHSRSFLDEIMGMAEHFFPRGVDLDGLGARDIAGLDEAIQSRSFFDEMFTVVEDFIRRDVYHDGPSARDISGLDEAIQSRGFWDEIKDAMDILRRNDNGDEVAARDAMDEFMGAATNPVSDKAVQSRSFLEEIGQIVDDFLRRDVSSGELDRRGFGMGGDPLDQFIDYFMMNVG